ncbi:NB-ARC domain, LRR domain containing protein [Parasponia andersonii]|uniref:NB-ARC domain, LRR domain containing protein n=1 Tax=Parasponia andersonii TaxID=3476 RepID=A0A2P5AL88_PARAD|nr:NB-ARC domain, LRR domain containing protein [Parasponia andersonii]
MAETAVAIVVDKLITLLTEEADLLTGVHREVDLIRRELQSILAFLKDADRRAEAEGNEISDGVKVWVEELREAAFQIEDVIDEYTHLMAKQQRQQGRRIIGFLRKTAGLIAELKPSRDIAMKLQELKETIRNINMRKATYGFSSTEQGSVLAPQNHLWYDPRKDSRFLKETEVVGIEYARDEVIGVLKGGFPRRTVISVVGMGGLGKTTLAHQIYDHVKGDFDCHAWIEVSQSYDKVKLLVDLMKKFYKARDESIPEEMGTIDEGTVTTKLRDYLQGKRYIVVFDDVWDTNFWGHIKNALPDSGEKSGRVLITTRHVEVANFCKTSSFVHIHHLQPLPPEKAWELFCNKAFQYEFEGTCPTDLDKLSREIVERCQGLPLAIVVIAGLLSTKNKTVDEWRKLLTSLSSELESNEHLTSITKILSLSYNDLPYYLKSCYLYFGIFPEDYSIRFRRLIRLWIAEGFVKGKKDKAAKVVAEEYLLELINRSLIQVSEVEFDGKGKSYRIHDLLREVILNKMEDLGFCQVLSRNDSVIKGVTRRISIFNVSNNVVKSCTPKTSHVRSVFIFAKEEMLDPLVCEVTRNFKLLKVLDFEDAPNLDHLPKDIGSLFHLKYLSLRGTKVRLLPKSIGNLENLETLDLKESLVFELPGEIKRLFKLQHLLAYDSQWTMHFPFRQRGVKVEMGIGRLKALQRLYFVEANVVGFDIFKELSNLTELKKLGIIKLRNEDGRTLCDCIQKMNHLESLDVASISKDDMIGLESMSSPPQNLQRLYIRGLLRTLPEWIKGLQNLVKIQIVWTKLEDDPLKALQNLHNLSELGLFCDAYLGEVMHFEQGAFPKLKMLWFCYLSRLRSLVVEEGALCHVEDIYIGPCPQLNEVPPGFQHLRNLKVVSFSQMPAKFLMFQNFWSLRKVPDVRFFCEFQGQIYFLLFKTVLHVQIYIRG